MTITKSLCIALMVLSTAFALELSAQTKTVKYTVTGQVLDTATLKGVEYATVSITTDSAKVLAIGAADANGKFTLEIKRSGTFTLMSNSLGFSLAKKKINVNANTTRIDAGTLYLTAGTEIKAVTLEVQKPLIKSDADKLTYSVEADPEAQTSTVVDIMRKVPQLTVDAEDNVMLNGESNFKVLINGKSSSMMSKNFKEVIRSMPASSIKDIEVITNPSTKYESEGVGGIINIITTKKAPSGYNGRVHSSYGTYGTYSANAYVAAQIGKLNLSTRVNKGEYKYPGRRGITNGENYLSQDNRYSEGSSKTQSNNSQLSFGVEASYEIDSLNLISLEFSGYDGGNNYNGLTISKYFNTNKDLTRHFTNSHRSKYSWGSLDGNINWQKTFKKPEKTFTISYKLESSPSSQNNLNEIDGIVNYKSYLQKSWNEASGTEHTVQVDYYNPITKKHHIELGTKYIIRLNVSDSETKLWDPENEDWVIDNKWKNDLDYTQNILGIYGGYLYKLKKLTTKVGFRVETTWNDGVSTHVKGDTKFNANLFNVVPYINFSYIPKAGNTVRLSYTQRLQRPSMWYLNPYVDDTDPMNISYGNPNLKSVISHSFTSNYSKFSQKWNLFIGVTASFTNNSITRIQTIDNQGVNRSTYDNIGKNQRFGVNGSYSYRIGTKFTLNLSAYGRYSVIESKANNLKNEGFNYGGNASVSVGVWKNGFIRASGGASSSEIMLQGSGYAYFYSSAGITQQLFKKKVDLGLFMYNPLTKTRSMEVTMSDPTFYSYNRWEYNARTIQFGIGYRFGKTETSVKKAKRTVTNDDKISGGGNGGSEGGGGN